eukprot:TRINITY_DN19607_c0_g1_i1.p1 TRINITY_DN19607_c0_g1~~TRINITY_DN19607_c0_g1_i1.p1  ORF type:complete len:478 (+),score=34.69 TRINITY_DN19607_c0_g1_i1:79-1434(+)
MGQTGSGCDGRSIGKVTEPVEDKKVHARRDHGPMLLSSMKSSTTEPKKSQPGKVMWQDGTPPDTFRKVQAPTAADTSQAHVATDASIAATPKMRWHELRAVTRVLDLRQHLYDKPNRALPNVEITVRVIRIANFDVKAQRVHLDFLVMMDWIDNLLIGASPDDVEWDHMFVPRISIDNSASEMEPDNVQPRLYDATRGWARLSARYRGELIAENLHMQKYPFDCQELRIQIKGLRRQSKKLRLASPGLRKESEHYKDGHCYDPAANQLDEWQLSGPLRGETSEDGEHYNVKLFLQRRCSHTLMNVCLPVLLMNILSFSVFVIDASELCNRLQITLTLLLTITTFKSSVANELPVYSYLTTMDTYFVYSIFVSFGNAAEHAIVAALLDAGGEQGSHSSLAVGSTNVLRVLPTSCSSAVEGIWLFLQLVCFVAVHVWHLRLYIDWQRDSPAAH